jgi:signal peptidase I
MPDSDRNTSVARDAKRRLVRRRLAILSGAIGLVWIVGVVGWEASTLRAFVIPSGSMAPAVRAGDRVTADIHPKSPPQRGEIWIAHIPGRPANNLAIKRVVGLPGETVEVKAGKVWIDGRPLQEPYLLAATPGVMPLVTLGPDEYFLLGDSRASAADSRIWGPLRGADLTGRVTYRFWPPHRLGGP